jgi:NADPH2:quinone reductase
MRAATYDRFGPPEVLKIVDVPEPSPSVGEVKVRVRATSVNPMDVVFRSGQLKGRMFSGVFGPKRTILGTDFAGEVVAAGPGADRVQVGDRVVGVTGFDAGAYAEYVCVDASTVATIPAEIGYPEAAAFSFAGVSSLLFLKAIDALEPGLSILIVGASGGLGTYAVQLAHHYGEDVTGVCSTRNEELVRSLGAKDVIDYTHQDPTAGHNAYDVVFDAVAAGSFGEYRKALRPGGVYSTTVLAPRAIIAMALNPLRRSGRRAHTMIGNAENVHNDLSTLRDLFLEGALRSVIERQLPLEEVAEAHRHYETGHTRGKIVLTV